MRPWLLALALLALPGQGSSGPPGQDGTLILEVGADVRVSAPGAPHVEPYIASNPQDARSVIVSASEMVRGKGTRARAYVSEDGGVHWQQAPLPQMEPEAQVRYAHDCWIAFGGDGTAYLAALANREARGQWGAAVLVYRSDDRGRSWREPAAISGRSFDRPAVAVVGRGDGARVYVSALISGKEALLGGGHSEADGAVLLRSDDRGASFRPVAFLAPDDLSHQPGNPVPLSEGRVVLPFGDYPGRASQGPRSARFYVARSEDGGETFGPPSFVADVPRAFGGFFMLAADESTRRYRGRLYVAWNGGDMGAQRGSGTWRDVSVAYSSDGGRSWSPPHTVAKAAGRPAYFNAIAISPAGVVGVAWVQHEDGPARAHCYRPYFSASSDGGQSFADAVALSQSVSCPGGSEEDDPVYPITGRRLSQEWPRGGDYIGLVAAADGRFHAVWIDAGEGYFAVHSAAVRVVERPASR